MKTNIPSKWTRRKFLATTTTGVPALAALSHLSTASQAQTTAQKAAPPTGGFSFPVLGDLHFDKLEHHDMEWLAKEYPNDVRQVQDYSRITAEVHPQLMQDVRAKINESKGRVPFVLHIGDLVEGLCGSEPRALTQNRESVDWLRAVGGDLPFLFCKGNHDVTGPGAREAFNQVFLPFLSGEIEKTAKPRVELQKARYAVQHGDALFAFFDAYNHPDSLEWLESTLKARTAQHVFVLIHPPVVPYNARANWHVYWKPNEQAERTRLLNLLGRHSAIVLSGHLHRYSTVVRQTPEGRFLQLAVSSILRKPDVQPEDILEGVAQYGPDLIAKTEPKFSPPTEAVRRELLQAEAPHIEYFEYADAPGYAMLNVDGARVQVQMYCGVGRAPWKTLDLSAILRP